MNTIYLEDLCKTLDKKADVRVRLSSKTIHADNIILQDGCGNHWAMNWITACEKMPNMFRVKDFKAEYVVDCIQYEVTLEQCKNYFTNRLSYLANEAAIYSRFEY